MSNAAIAVAFTGLVPYWFHLVCIFAIVFVIAFVCFSYLTLRGPEKPPARRAKSARYHEISRAIDEWEREQAWKS